MTKLDWFTVLTGAASVASLLLAGVLWPLSTRQVRATNRLIAQGDTGTHTILARMNDLAEQRQREVIEVIQAMRR
jgi:hypothetical protein